MHIIDIQLSNLRNRLEERHIHLTLTEAARTHLVRTGYEPTYGARPLKRAIQKQVETRLGRLLIAGKVRDGEDVVVDYDGSSPDLTFRSSPMVSADRAA
jgi:ATP-dependent Clp protease ATP-binding subunit ClpB